MSSAARRPLGGSLGLIIQAIRRRIPPEQAWLAAILIAHVWIGLSYERATPVFEASDEGSHYAVVQWLAQGRPLPVQDPRGPEQVWHQEGSQPPLYYLLAARLVALVRPTDFAQVFVQNPLSRVGIPGTPYNANLYRHPLGGEPLAGTVLAVRLVRWFTLALSALTIYLVYRLAHALSPGHQPLALLAASFAAFNPMALFVNASVNNDNLLMLLSTAALLVMIGRMQPGAARRWRPAAALGVLLGLAALTKVSGLVLWPVAGLALLAGHLRRRSSGEPFAVLAGEAAVVFALALAISGWWFWRNQQLYGEWLGLNTMVAIAGPRAQPVSLLPLVWQEAQGFYMSFWGVFGVFTILPPGWVFAFYTVLVGWARTGAVRELLVRRVRPSAEFGLLLLFCLLTLAGVIRWTMQTPASQGRLLFGAIAPLSIALAGGILAAARPLLRLRAGRQWANGLVVTLAGALALVAAVLPDGVIAPRYAPPPRIADTDFPPDLKRVYATFDKSIELVGYTVPDDPVRPGGTQPVTLYWRALRPMEADYALALHLLGRKNVEVGKIDTWPGGGNAPTSSWPVGTVLSDTYYVPLTTTMDAPSVLALDLYFWEGDSSRRLPISTPGDGTPSSVVLRPAGRAVGLDNPRPEPTMRIEASFEHAIELAGYDAVAETSVNGGALSLTLYWRLNSGRVPADYTVFVHLVGEDGVALVPPADGPPRGGDWPTSAWVPGEWVVDERVIALPPVLPLGRYTAQVGFYDPASGARLLAYQSNGTRWPNDVVSLPVFEVR
jgi:4-amino-4-deoxy-L-arabinose transferase-like glycosyltransferase